MEILLKEIDIVYKISNFLSRLLKIPDGLGNPTDILIERLFLTLTLIKFGTKYILLCTRYYSKEIYFYTNSMK